MAFFDFFEKNCAIFGADPWHPILDHVCKAGGGVLYSMSSEQELNLLNSVYKNTIDQVTFQCGQIQTMPLTPFFTKCLVFRPIFKLKIVQKK